MKEVTAFDFLNCKLKGSHLIEASAGTGKTFTITRIFLRLILDGRPAHAILVVTFTVAATKELRERIRYALHQALAQLNGEAREEADDIARLLRRYPLAKTKKRLEAALNGFDQLNVHTIHSFCSRVLEERSLSTSTPPLSEFSPNDKELGREIILDFWRRYVQNAPREFLQFMIELGTGLEEWCNFFNNRRSTGYWSLPVCAPYKTMVTAFSPQALEKQEKALLRHIQKCKQEFSAWQELWPKQQETALAFLLTLKKKSRLRKPIEETILAGLDQHFQNKEFSLLPFAIEKELAELYEKSRQAIDADFLKTNSFASFWQSYRQTYESLVYALRDHLLFVFMGLAGQYNAELDQKKKERQLLCYDDFLIRLHRALHDHPWAEKLLSHLRRKYCVALIDEFQDTDRLQAEIFQKIFDKQDLGLFLIGDPRQSIYSFRGSDIHVYQKLRSRVNVRSSLLNNYRSAQPLLSGLHAIYEAHRGYPFLEAGLSYLSTKAARENKAGLLQWKAASAKEKIPLRFVFPKAGWTLDLAAAEKFRATEQQVGKEILHLLRLADKDQLNYKNRPLCAGDIAVLVRKNQHGSNLAESLRNMGIPAVLCNEENVFSMSEASDLDLILQAILEGGRSFSVKAALSTELWGYTAQDIYALFQSEQQQEELLARFQRYRRAWLEKGFIAMFRTWLYDNELPFRLLRRFRGERSLTNLLHLAELIHLNGAGEPQGDLRFLREQIDTTVSSTDEMAQLRLESDENAVQIMTIHASKGLEFPIVFCPYLWDHTKNKRAKVLNYYNKKKAISLTVPVFLQNILKFPLGHHSLKKGLAPYGLDSLDLAAMKLEEEEETFAEELRLVYVTLTRATERLYIYWNSTKKDSAAYYLFSGGDGGPAATRKKDTSKDSSELLQRVAGLAKEHPDSIALEEVSPISQEERYQSRKQTIKLLSRSFERKLHVSCNTHSFSSLVRQKKDEVSLVYADPHGLSHWEKVALAAGEKEEAKATETEANAASWSEGRSIFSFPRGTKAGNFLHSLLEEIDFGQALKDRAKLDQDIERMLRQYNYDPEWKDCLSGYIRRLLQTPLLSGQKPSQDLLLGCLSRQQRLAELEFYFDLDAAIPHSVKTTDREAIAQDIGELWQEEPFYITERFLRGFVDLVFEYSGRFYILDWKSNFLGSQAEDYSIQRMTENILHFNYRLQYYIYMDALDRFLRLRLPNYEYEHHFGGVFYIYLRGINPPTRTGIYFDRPSLEELLRFRYLYSRSDTRKVSSIS